jgi:hypothetical protein
MLSKTSRINAKIKKHINDEYWNWRNSNIKPEDEIDALAIQQLRDEEAKACRWLEMASQEIGMPLPIGNGTNGPWHRSAVIDANNKFGLCDIAAGRIAWTDTIVPPYVKRFAVYTSNIYSTNPVGGSGGAGTAHRQIALMYGMYGMAQPEIEKPHPKVIKIEWGLRTCYGNCGDIPSADDFRSEWADIVKKNIHVSETQTEQQEVAVKGIDKDLANQYLDLKTINKCEIRHLRSEVIVKKDMIVGRVNLEVAGIGDSRRKTIDTLRNDFEQWARVEAAIRAAAVVQELFYGACLPGPRLSYRMCYHYKEWPLTDVRVQRAFLELCMPPDPLTPEERALVIESAKKLLSLDPVEVGLSLRDPWGRPGYPDGANRVDYILPKGTKNYDDITDYPGVTEWLNLVRNAAKEECNRLNIGSGPVRDSEIERLKECGYQVERTEFGSIKCHK